MVAVQRPAAETAGHRAATLATGRQKAHTALCKSTSGDTRGGQGRNTPLASNRVEMGHCFRGGANWLPLAAAAAAPAAAWGEEGSEVAGGLVKLVPAALPAAAAAARGQARRPVGEQASAGYSSLLLAP